MLLLQSRDLGKDSIFLYVAGVLPGHQLLLKRVHDLRKSCVFQPDTLDFCAGVLDSLENFKR